MASKWTRTAVAAAAAVLLAGCGSPAPTGSVPAGAPPAPTTSTPAAPAGSSSRPADPPPAASRKASPAAPAGSGRVPAAGARTDALTVLAAIDIEAEQNDGYERDYFADGWIDADGDGCDTRDEVLAAESQFPAGSYCGGDGAWLSVYDGIRSSDPSSFDIDHMVPLAEAWGSGARAWDAGTRLAYANDLAYERSLIAVSAASNRSKSDQDPSTWLPPRSSYHCTYLRDWVAIKYRWRLSADSAEAAAVRRGLQGCAEQQRSLVVPPRANVVKGAPPVVQAPSGGGAGAGGGGKNDPRFPSCSAAKAAGLGPYVSGRDPEYAWYRDGDSDGTVCE